MNLHFKQLNEKDMEIKILKELYESAFPKHERRDLMPILQDDSGTGEILAIYAKDELCGFICSLYTQSIAHIIYFAIFEELRSLGIGSEALKQFSNFCQKNVIVDIESDEFEEALGIRHQRKAFYLRNGFHETEVKYHWRDEAYEILATQPHTRADFEAFWDEIYHKSDLFQAY